MSTPVVVAGEEVGMLVAGLDGEAGQFRPSVLAGIASTLALMASVSAEIAGPVATMAGVGIGM